MSEPTPPRSPSHSEHAVPGGTGPGYSLWQMTAYALRLGTLALATGGARRLHAPRSGRATKWISERTTRKD